MSRIKIKLPDHFPFSVAIPIRITDVNYGGHVGNDTMLSLIHEARVQFLKSLAYTEMNVEGVSLIMSDVGIEFRSELFYGDTITAFVAATDCSRIGFDICYKFVKTSDKTIIAIAKTGMVCYNYTHKKMVSLPEEARERLEQ